MTSVHDADEIIDELDRARRRTLAICDAVSEQDQCAQHSPLMSPIIWDLAHVASYEELWLLRALDGRAPIDPDLDGLYNAFEHPRWERPALDLLGPQEARNYNATVREAVLEVLESNADHLDPAADDASTRERLLAGGYVYGMAIQHEHQHCETLLATLQLMGERSTAPPGAALTGTAPGPMPDTAHEMVSIGDGEVEIGNIADPWAYDNEHDRHTVQISPFRIGRHPVVNRQWVEFIDDGGYDVECLWSPQGWSWRQEAGLVAPQFWERVGGGWTVLRFGRSIDVDEIAAEPTQHVCFYEAEAFARWAGARLPTEYEWEAAAASGRLDDTARDPNLGQRLDGPSPIGARGMIGDVWEWTASSFTPYPGFEAFPYDEYSKVFFGDAHRVLRGGSWATDPVAVRPSFRNWDLPIRRQIFSGLRLATDA